MQYQLGAAWRLPKTQHHEGLLFEKTLIPLNRTFKSGACRHRSCGALRSFKNDVGQEMQGEAVVVRNPDGGVKCQNHGNTTDFVECRIETRRSGGSVGFVPEATYHASVTLRGIGMATNSGCFLKTVHRLTMRNLIDALAGRVKSFFIFFAVTCGWTHETAGGHPAWAPNLIVFGSRSGC